jgi:hypothetical protein
LARKIRISKSSIPKLILGYPALKNLALGLCYASSKEGKGRVFEFAVRMNLPWVPCEEVIWWQRSKKGKRIRTDMCSPLINVLAN